MKELDIEPTTFDLVSRNDFFKLLPKIGRPPDLLRVITSAPTLFGIFLLHAVIFFFGDSNEGIYLHTRSDGKLFNLARLL